MVNKRRFFTIVASLFVMICVDSVARAQSEESKIEVGSKLSQPASRAGSDSADYQADDW